MSTLAAHQRQLLGIAKTWAIKNLPGWDDDCHRDLLQRHGATVLPSPGLRPPSPASGRGNNLAQCLPSPAGGRGNNLAQCLPSPASGRGAGGEGGHISALTLSGPQLANALRDYQRRGWPFQPGKGRGVPVTPAIAHLVRLWGRLGNAGALEQCTRAALLSYCSRQSGRTIADLDSLTAKELLSCTEGLKAWLQRATA